MHRPGLFSGEECQGVVREKKGMETKGLEESQMISPLRFLRGTWEDKEALV